MCPLNLMCSRYILQIPYCIFYILNVHSPYILGSVIYLMYKAFIRLTVFIEQSNEPSQIM